MVRLTLKLSEELHRKLQWLSFKEQRSQQAILEKLVEQALKDTEIPEEARK